MKSEEVNKINFPTSNGILNNTCNVKNDCRNYPCECHSPDGFGCFGYPSKSKSQEPIINEKNTMEYISHKEGITGTVGIIG